MDASSISLLPLSVADLDRVMELVGAVRWPHRRADVDLLIRLGHGRMVRGAGDNGGMGVGMWWPVGDRLGRFGMIIVDPEMQCSGLGRKLLNSLIEDARPDGRTRALELLATEAGAPLYASLGFVPVGSARQQHGDYLADPISDSRLRLATPEDFGAICHLDFGAQGVDRAPILRALIGAGRAAVLVEGGAVIGYAIDRDFGRGSVVGPIVARSEDAAIMLFRFLARPGFVRVDIPADAAALGDYVLSRGLAPAGTDSPVMVLGDRPPRDGAIRAFGMASHALG